MDLAVVIMYQILQFNSYTAESDSKYPSSYSESTDIESSAKLYGDIMFSTVI